MITIPSFPIHHFLPLTLVCDLRGGGWDTGRVKSVEDFSPDGLREVRDELGWSQNDAAKAIGTTPNSVGRWERGKGAPSPRLFAALVEKTGMPRSRFLKPLSADADLATLRTRAGFRQEDVAERLGVQASDVSAMEQGTGRIRDEWAPSLCELYRVSAERLTQARENTEQRWHERPEAVQRHIASPEERSTPSRTLAEKIDYLLEHTYPGDQVPPTDADIAHAVNKHAGAIVISAAGVRDLRTGAQATASPIVGEGLGELFGVTALYFQPDEDVARQVIEGFKALTLSNKGNITRVAARGLGEEGVSPDVIAYLAKLAMEFQEGRPADGG
jgi:transcriptional regulator with XRE-family HTH domain